MEGRASSLTPAGRVDDSPYRTELRLPCASAASSYACTTRSLHSGLRRGSPAQLRLCEGAESPRPCTQVGGLRPYTHTAYVVGGCVCFVVFVPTVSSVRRMLGHWEAASNDLRRACRIDFDPDTEELRVLCDHRTAKIQARQAKRRRAQLVSRGRLCTCAFCCVASRSSWTCSTFAGTGTAPGTADVYRQCGGTTIASHRRIVASHRCECSRGDGYPA